ncbi:hypothetical protein BJY16_006125 [Actinoplanes octamycinicus]|uniref:FtsX extracellular domain-containing protein n=1 Tax=Actinoplanes octamycinicus TaxID=135948 RepID=A0A7W7MA89_9ACTN|nr:permease-like cell division protein FtsX [Actinoplanes octamycinicus]MBB4742666.1 hypothetical protein [Actinoplanes octamycinicus]GIE61004.1 hypothetical protein Aoc01nite_64060 [Actinoplanes octamycinicus]
MTRNVRDYFDEAVSGDPGAPLDEMAAVAIASGGRLRRQRRTRRMVAAVAAGAVAVTGLSLWRGAPDPAGPPETVAAAMQQVSAPSCLPRPVQTDATDVVVVLASTATDAQRAALRTALGGDARVSAIEFDTREQAYQRFRDRWADNPDLLAVAAAQPFPESFRLRLVSAGQFAGLRADYAASAGVDQVIGRRCGTDAPVGGAL